MGLTYEDAGVDIAEGERLVDRIKPLAAATRIPEVLGSIGGFAGLCGLPEGIEDPVLVSGTDGVGTKLEVAIQAGRHDTVGIDLVAMCVNDVVTVGARPLFFLDYFATGKLDVDQAEAVVRGIADGCKLAGCALLGGETAELPGFYTGGRYDLAGFTVGVAERSQLLDGSAVRAGDVLLGLASSGLHSNGFSLARRALLHGEDALPLGEPAGSMSEPLGDVLLEPTRIYVKAALAALKVGGIHALCHVTGGGLPGNLPRVLPAGLGAAIEGAWDEPPIFDLIRQRGQVAVPEMRRTFNLGIGFVAVVDPARADAIARAFEDSGETVTRLGHVESSDASGEARVRYPS